MSDRPPLAALFVAAECAVQPPLGAAGYNASADARFRKTFTPALVVDLLDELTSGLYVVARTRRALEEIVEAAGQYHPSGAAYVLAKIAAEALAATEEPT